MARKIVKVFSNAGKLYLSFPVALSQEVYGVNQKRISLNMEDSPDRNKYAWALARSIQADIDMNRFDSTLEKYGLAKARFQAIAKMYEPKPEKPLLEIWDEYVKYKAVSLKTGTLVNYATMRNILVKCGEVNARKLRDKLLKATSQQWARKVLTHLSACYKWAVKHELATSNPYEGLNVDIPKSGYEVESKPNPFTEEEKQRIYQAFLDSRNYNHYGVFVNFLFLTGCRPSEAIGLQWKDINRDKGEIYFRGSITQSGGKMHRNTGSKNNKNRVFPINNKLAELFTHVLLNSDLRGISDDDLVFHSPVNYKAPINYGNFSNRAWKRIVNPIKPDTTPYCCRDTFITEQVNKGIPAATVAQWCDTSVRMIEKHYLGKSNLVPM